MSADTETLIIGASAAGLAVGACLRHAGRSVELLEATDVVGTAWRHHYDRLHLHTPKSASALPAFAMSAAWPRYPTREQVIEYLETYRDHHGLVPHHGQAVTRLERRDDQWCATTRDRTWRGANVVIATGYTRKPIMPQWPGMDSYRGQVLHSSAYRNGAPWKDRPVLVVGFGNSACEQAIDLVEHGAHPHLAVRSAVNVIPRDLLGVPILELGIAMRHLPAAVADLLAWPLIRLTIGDITKVGLQKLPYGPNQQIARDRRIPLLDIGTMELIRAGRIGVHGGIARFTEQGVVFESGDELAVDAVVLATGYRPQLDDFFDDWRAVCDDTGVPRISGAPTALPGLYFCGFFVSPAGMLREISLEARRIATHISGVQ